MQAVVLTALSAPLWQCTLGISLVLALLVGLVFLVKEKQNSE